MMVFRPSHTRISSLSFSHTIASILFCTSLLACSEVRPLANAKIEQDAPFLHNGSTTAQQIEGRLGFQYDSYEGGRIKIYRVSFDKYERLTLAPGWPCYALILVFDEAWVLQRHSLIENGCGSVSR